MYRLMKEEKEIALANEMHYIRMQENGAYGLCDKREADGVAADGAVYHFGKDIDTVDFVDGVAELEILNIILEGE
jgi:hypothetical protein